MVYNYGFVCEIVLGSFIEKSKVLDGFTQYFSPLLTFSNKETHMLGAQYSTKNIETFQIQPEKFHPAQSFFLQNETGEVKGDANHGVQLRLQIKLNPN